MGVERDTSAKATGTAGTTAAGGGADAPVKAAAPKLLQFDARPFTKTRKVYDPLSRPFHRLNSPSFDIDAKGGFISKVRSSGDGHACGCRNPDDFKSSVFGKAIVGAVVDAVILAVTNGIPGAKDALDKVEEQAKKRGVDPRQAVIDFLSNTLERALFGGFMRFIPSWVPVNRQSYGPSFNTEDAHNVDAAGREQEVEVQGRLSRSYQTHHHRPYTQWSHYYQWAFHVDPMPGFKHLVGKGNVRSKADKATDRSGASSNDDPREGAIFIYDESSQHHLECLLDVGAFSIPPGNQKGQPAFVHPGVFYDKSWPTWPQSEDWFWAAGRYVYDCTHVTPPVKNEEGKDVELSPTLINPVKAFAVGRYEAALFEESDEPIPVTTFSFFACKRGGYYDFEGKHIAFNGENYEFAVDLPAVPEDKTVFDIGQISNFAKNTLVIRPRLLQKIEFAPYLAGADSQLLWARVQPIIQVVPGPDGTLPRMVKVTVPLKDFPDGSDACGFTISFGWLAPGVPRGVKKVTVKLDNLRLNGEKESLRMSVCVNGRWIFVPTTKPVGRDITSPHDLVQNFPDAAGLVFHLPPEKSVHVTAHGMHRRGFGEFIETLPTTNTDSRKDRRLSVGGVINLDPETEKILKEAVETKLGDIIPAEFWGKAKPVQEALDNDNFRKLLGKAVEDLVGQRRIAVWEEDVDFIEADATKKHEIACAVAREMSVFPVDAFNKPNEPMGFLERGGFASGTVPANPPEFDMKSLTAKLQNQKSASNTVSFTTQKTIETNDGGYIAFFKNGDEQDYILKVTATIADPDPPK